MKGLCYQLNPIKIWTAVIIYATQLEIATVSSSLFILFLPIDCLSDELH